MLVNPHLILVSNLSKHFKGAAAREGHRAWGLFEPHLRAGRAQRPPQCQNCRDVLFASPHTPFEVELDLSGDPGAVEVILGVCGGLCWAGCCERQ